MPSLDLEFPDGTPDEYLDIVDSRTGNKYRVPIKNNSVAAADLSHITAPKDLGNPSVLEDTVLRVFDPGFKHTACVESSITYVLVPDQLIQFGQLVNGWTNLFKAMESVGRFIIADILFKNSLKTMITKRFYIY